MMQRRDPGESPERAVSGGNSLHPRPFLCHRSSLISCGCVCFVALSFTFVAQNVRADEVGHVDTPGDAYGVDLDGHYAYVADQMGGIQVVDCSDPTAPIIVGNVEPDGWATGIDVHDGYAYVANFIEGLQVFDLSNPVHPVQIWDAPDGCGFDVAIVDGLAFFADFCERLKLYDVSDPLHPQHLGTVEPTYSGQAYDVVVGGHYVYVADGDGGLGIVDVSDPTQPATAGSLGVGNWKAMGVDLYGSYAVVADPESDILYVVDISDPTSPQEIASAPAAGGLCVRVGGRYAYAVGTEGTRVVDISDPENPIVIGTLDAPGHATDVTLVGPHAYIANGPYGLYINEIAYDPADAEDRTGSPMSNLLIRPNPAHTQVSLILQSTRNREVAFGVFDLSGRLVRSLNAGNREAGRTVITWDGRDESGSAVSQGIYLVRSSWGGEVVTSRIVWLR